MLKAVTGIASLELEDQMPKRKKTLAHVQLFIVFPSFMLNTVNFNQPEVN